MRVVTLLTGQPQLSGSSGLSGPVEIPDPPAGRDRDPRTRRARLKSTALAIATGIPRVLSLVWASGKAVTIGLAVATLVAGLIPAATAYLSRALINTVASAIKLHAVPGVADGTITLRLPGLPLHLPPLTPAVAILAVVTAQFLVFQAGSITGAVSQICTELLNLKVSLHIQHRIMAHASRLDLAFFEDSASYDLLNQANGQATTRPTAMIGGTFGLVQAAITFASMIGLLAALNPLLAALAVAAPIPAFVVDLRYGGRGFDLSMWTSPARRRMDYLSQLVTRDIYVKEVQLFGLAPHFVERFRLLGSAYNQRQGRLIVRRRFAAPAWNTIGTVASALTYAYVGFSAVAGRLTLGDIALYTAAVVGLQGSIGTIFQGVSAMYESNLYLDVLYRLLATRPRLAIPAAPAALAVPARGHVVFEHVGFGYPGAAKQALADVSFEVRPGQTVAVVGPNGAGKSTLVKLLCRLYQPDQGRILLDGVDIAGLDPRELRRQIGALFQDYVTYQGTAAENIGLGDLDHLADDDAIRLAAQRAGAAELVGRLPRGYDTPLGKWFDNGANLSGGEWQKVALARAFMRTAPLLVLDEPSSALDAAAEHELFARLRNLADGRSTLCISHRFSTVRRADWILVLDGGRIAEAGTHQQLLDAGGLYARLFRMQAEAYTDGPAGVLVPAASNSDRPEVEVP
jgi:ATP-binding cassette subfamily B protein